MHASRLTSSQIKYLNKTRLRLLQTYRFNHIHIQILEFYHKEQKSPESMQRFEINTIHVYSDLYVLIRVPAHARRSSCEIGRLQSLLCQLQIPSPGTESPSPYSPIEL